MANEDELLVVRCQLGEAAAFEVLVGRWHEPLCKYMRRVSGNDDRAADAVQDVWLRVIRGLPRLRDPSRLRPWLFGIARHVAMDRLRARYAAPELAETELDEIAREVEPDADEWSAHAEFVQQELPKMPVAERELLVLFYLKELTLGDLADVLGVPIGTVKSRLFRARRMLRERAATKGVA